MTYQKNSDWYFAEKTEYPKKYHWRIVLLAKIAEMLGVEFKINGWLFGNHENNPRKPDPVKSALYKERNKEYFLRRNQKSENKSSSSPLSS